MRIQLVDSACGGDRRIQYATSFVVNDTLAIDAGALGYWRTPADQARIEHVVVTHSHADHIATLPAFAENAYEPGRPPVTVWGNADVLTCLRNDVFNGRVWPNFLELPTPAAPFLRLETLESEVPVVLGGVRVTPVLVNHAVRTFGLVLETADSTVVLTSDTGPTDRIWDVANKLDRLSAVFVQAAFPDELGAIADVAKHLTPAGLRAELGKLRRPARTFVVHLKPRYQAAIAAQLAALGLPNLELGEPGKEYVL